MSTTSNAPSKVGNLFLEVDSTSGEIMGYGFSVPSPSTIFKTFQVHGEKVRKIELRDGLGNKLIKWDFGSSSIINISQSLVKKIPLDAKMGVNSRIAVGWSSMTTEEKTNCLAKFLGITT